MAYGKEDALKTMQEIIDDKQRWQIAGNVKHKINGMNAQDYYHQDAQKKYDELIANGYRTEANNLKNSNLEQAKKYINNYYVKTGRSQFRPYMYEKGKQYGLTSKDIDNLTSFDSETGEVIFAGKNIGKPDGISYNRSYFGSDYLDEVWDNYVNENGLTLPKDTVADQISTKAMNYIDNLAAQQSGNRDYIMSTGKEQRQRKDDFINSQQNADIFKTDAAKTIMDKFNYMGGVAGGNAVAEGASSNNGNIDSFSAANRARQQLAYTSAGADAVISEYQNRMNNIMETLKSIDSQNTNEYGALSINHQNGLDTSKLYTDNAKQLYDVIDREKQTDNNIKLSDRESKGYFYDYSSNPFLNEDGSVKDINRDYTAIYNDAIARKDEQTAKWASEAAYQKIMSDPSQYGKFYNSAIHKLNPEDYKHDTAVVGSDKRGDDTTKYVSDNDLEGRMHESDNRLKEVELSTEAQKWMTQLDSNTQIELKKLDNESVEKLAKISLEGQKYGIDANVLIANVEADAVKYGHDKNEIISKMTIDGQIAIAQMSNETQIKLKEFDVTSAEKLAKMSLEVQKYGIDANVLIAEIQAASEKYGVDANVLIAQISADTTKYGIDAEKWKTNLEAELERYAIDMNYKKNTDDNEKDIQVAKISNNNGLNENQTKVLTSLVENGDVSVEEALQYAGFTEEVGKTEEKTEQTAPMTNEEIAKIVNQLNSGYKDSKGKTYKAIDINKDGTYKVKSGFEEYVALNVYNNADLTQSQKEELLTIFKVPANKVQNVLRDNQYRRAQDDWNWPQ